MGCALQEKVNWSKEINSYLDYEVEEARRNYIEEYGKEPTPEDLKRYVESGEESKYFFKKRNSCLV